MSNISLDRLSFDPTAVSDGPSIGSYIIGADGEVVNETLVGSDYALDVNVVQAVGGANEDDPATSGDSVQPIGMVRQDTLATDTSADGDYSFAKVNAKGEQYVIDSDGNALLTTIDANVEDIEDLITALSKAEDSGHTTGDQGIMSLAVRNDTEGSLVDTDLDYAPLQVDSSGRLRVITDLDLTGDLPGDDDPDTTDPLKVGHHAYDQSAVLGALSAAGDMANSASDLYRRQFINDAPNVGGSNEAVTIDTTVGGVALGTASSGRTRMMVQNRGDKSIFVGFGTVTSANGIEVGKGDTASFETGEALAWKAIADSGSQDVRVLHWG